MRTTLSSSQKAYTRIWWKEAFHPHTRSEEGKVLCMYAQLIEGKMKESRLRQVAAFVECILQLKIKSLQSNRRAGKVKQMQERIKWRCNHFRQIYESLMTSFFFSPPFFVNTCSSIKNSFEKGFSGCNLASFYFTDNDLPTFLHLQLTSRACKIQHRVHWMSLKGLEGSFCVPFENILITESAFVPKCRAVEMRAQCFN